MTTPVLPLANYPTDELVAQYWVASVPGFSLQMVATQLPPDATKDGQTAQWVLNGNGFVTVSVVGGGSDPLLPVKRPVIQCDCWATRPGSNKPPWNVANRLAEHIRHATLSRRNICRPLAITVRGVPYGTAVVQGAYVTAAPRRMWDDPGRYAHYSMDVALSWVTAGEHLD